MKRALLIMILMAGVAALSYFYYLRRPQNVILITVDTLRADHLSLYGYHRKTSPELDARATKALIFDRAFVQWPKTVPSMISMFSSTYAQTNGIRFGSRGQYVAEELVTLTEALKQQGYSTYGVVSNAVLADETNFSQGFDVYQETWMDTSRGEAHSRADHVTDLAIKALDQLKGKKFFLWIHYVDPHYHYYPPPPFNGMYIGDQYYNKNRILKVHEDDNFYDGIAKRIWDLDHSNEWDYYIAQYDAEIRFLDHHLKRLFEKFDSQNLWNNSLIYFTADHGESLGENHYFFEHGWFPYTSCSHVPLLVWDPGSRPGRISRSVALLDMAPSILKRMKISAPQSFEGKPWDFENPRLIYTEAGEGGLTKFNYIRSIWSWPYHLVYVPSKNYQSMMQKSLFELYNVEKDWNETQNIWTQNPDIAKKLEKQLFHWIRSSPSYAPPPNKTPDYDPEAIEQMEALGYLQ